jgi:hypothetical protein
MSVKSDLSSLSVSRFSLKRACFSLAIGYLLLVGEAFSLRWHLESSRNTDNSRIVHDLTLVGDDSQNVTKSATFELSWVITSIHEKTISSHRL